jgi:hypothetical protein
MIADAPHAEALAAWETFYVIVGSSGAALVGLQFVVLTLIAERRSSSSMATLSAFGTPTVVHFAGALTVSAVMSAPWPSLFAASIALSILAILGFLYIATVIRHARRQTEYKPEREDWIWYVITPTIVYAALTIAALTLSGESHAPLFVIAGSALALLLIGIRNAWDTVTYIVVGGHTREPDAMPRAEAPPAKAANGAST